MHGTALFINLFAVPKIDIPYLYPKFQVRFLCLSCISLRKENFSFFHRVFSIIKNNKGRCRDLDLPAPVKILISDHSGITVTDIKKTA